ncbi:MAG: hypothetical protein JWQ27_1208 [Ferruginibacter sp.]|nr:hypothetical protein [Ferruginibacter sp.]
MTGTFKANNPYNNFLLFVYGLLLKLPMFIHAPQPATQPLDGVLYTSFLKFLSPLAHNLPVIYSIISFILLFIQALGFNSIVNAQRMHQKPNYLTGMSYLLITSLFNEWYSLSAPLIVNTMLIWVWSRLCTLYNNPHAKTTIFNIGFVLGISAFFYFPSIAFVLLMMVGLIIARPFKLPEWLMGFVGIITPFYFYASWLFLSGRWKSYRFPGFKMTLPTFDETNWGYAASLLVLLTVLVGIFFIQNNLRRQVVQTRKSWYLLFLYLAVALLAPFLNPTHSFDYWILVAVPVSLIVASAFLYPDKKWFPLAIHWGMVAISIAIGYFVH